jgi:hypothetical protein
MLNAMHTNPAVPCDTVINLHVTAFAELFSAYGLTPHRHREGGGDAARFAYASVLGAAGKGIRLSSTLSLDREVLVRTHPCRGRVIESDVQDWCCELNNQLVGRLKNKLLRLGCDVTTGLPVLIMGAGMVAQGAADQNFRQIFYSSRYGCIAVAVSLMLAPELTLDARQAGAEGEAVGVEGTMSLFQAGP